MKRFFDTGIDQLSKDTAESIAKELKDMTLDIKEDVVNEPKHYKQGSFEVIDEMILVFGFEDTIKFCRMNAWKYRARAPYKGNTDQDLAKVNCYLEMAADLEAIRNGGSFTLLKEGRVEVYG